MPRLDYEALRIIRAPRARTLKEVNDELENPLTSKELILRAINIEPNSNTDRLRDITGLANSTITRGVKMLKADGLITKVPRKNKNCAPSVYFYPVDQSV